MKRFSYEQTKDIVFNLKMKKWVDYIKITSVTETAGVQVLAANIKIYGKKINNHQKYANKMFTSILSNEQLTELKNNIKKVE